MIKHIVLFKIKDLGSESAKSLKMNEIKQGLEALIDKVPELKDIKVGLNCNPNEQYDIVLITEFNDMQGLEIYAKHPDHVAVSKIIGEVKEGRACVDYIF